MFAAERIRLIKKLLLENKKVDVSELSNLLSVTEVTIRRDLEKLDNENFLIRTHGGAILNEEKLAAENWPYESIKDDFFLEKSIIGKIASLMVRDNDTIILGPGITCLHIAKNISEKKNLRVVTNDINIATELANESPNIKVVLTGGDLDPSTLQLSGTLTESILDGIYVNRSFIEVDGVHMENGYSVESIEKASVIKKIMSKSKESIAVCDYSKFNSTSFYYLCPITTFSKVISNEQVPGNYKQYFFENGIKLFITYDVYEG